MTAFPLVLPERTLRDTKYGKLVMQYVINICSMFLVYSLTVPFTICCTTFL